MGSRRVSTEANRLPGLKNVVPAMRSINCMNSVPVSTGVENSARIAVMNSDQTLRGMRKSVMPGARILIIVTT